jgi:hypothetical protein
VLLWKIGQNQRRCDAPTKERPEIEKAIIESSKRPRSTNPPAQGRKKKMEIEVQVQSLQNN